MSGAVNGGDRPAARRTTGGFVAVCLGYFVIILDGSVLNVAVPAIQRDLGTSLAGAQWVLNGYTLLLAALLLTAGALGDRVGLRRTFLCGLAVFTAASVVCATADSTGALVVGRVVQGIGGAALLPATLALIPHLFPDRARRERAAVIWVATSALAVAVGPLLGGVLIDAFGWRSVFLINVPVGVAGGLLARATIGETPRRRTGADPAGQFLAVAGLGLTTAGLIRGGAAGWTAPSAWVLLAGGLLALGAFGPAERRVRHPLLPHGFLADRSRAAAVVSTSLMGFVFYSTLFLMSLFFQQVRGWSPAAAGTALLPMTVGTMVAPVALYKPLSARYGHWAMLISGFAGCTVGVTLLLRTSEHVPYLLPAGGLLIVGLCSTTVLSAVTSILISSVSSEWSGLASGVQNTARQTGALVGVAVVGAIVNTEPPAVVVHLHIALAVLGAAAVAGACAGVVALNGSVPVPPVVPPPLTPSGSPGAQDEKRPGRN